MYIGDGKEFVLPSIGSLLLLRNRTSSSAKERTFLEFSKYANGNYLEQVRYFANLWDKTEIDINRFFLHLSDNVFATLQKDSIFDLQDIGQFRLLDNAILFVSHGLLEDIVDEHGETRISTSQYPKVNVLHPMDEQSSVEETEEATGVQRQNVEITTNKSDDKYFVSRPLHFRKVAAILLIFITAFSSLFIYNNYSIDNNVPSRFSLEDIGYEESELNKAPVVIDFPDNAVVVEGKNPESDNSSMATIVIEETKNVVDTLEDAKLEVSEISATSEETYEPQKPTQQVELIKCTYVLGSFGNNSNVNELNKKLIQMGVELYNEQSGPLTRVGAIISCDNEDIISQLKIISPRMWLL